MKEIKHRKKGNAYFAIVRSESGNYCWTSLPTMNLADCIGDAEDVCNRFIFSKERIFVRYVYAPVLHTFNFAQFPDLSKCEVLDEGSYKYLKLGIED